MRTRLITPRGSPFFFAIIGINRARARGRGNIYFWARSARVPLRESATGGSAGPRGTLPRAPRRRRAVTCRDIRVRAHLPTARRERRRRGGLARTRLATPCFAPLSWRPRRARADASYPSTCVSRPLPALA